MRTTTRRSATRRSVAFALLLLPAGLPDPATGQALQSRLLRYSAVVDGSRERALRWPVDVASGGADELVAADAWESRAVLFRRVGAGWSLQREVALPAPPVAVTHAQGRYLVAVRGAGRLYAFAGGESTSPLQEIALPGGILPSRLAVASDGGLLVADARLGRVVKLRDGAIAVEVAFEHTVTAVASDGQGGFWAATGESGEVHRYDGVGKPLARWRLPADGPIPPWPAGLASDSAGRLFALDRHAHRVVVLDVNGGLVGVGAGKGWEPGQLLFPGGLARLANGELVVGDGGNGRVQLFDLVGPGAR